MPSMPFACRACKSITIEGRVESVQWKDPHTLIVLRLDDGTACTLDWNGLSSLTNDRNIGPAKAAAQVFGARIAVTGNAIWSSAQSPPRDNSYAAEIALLKDSLRRRVAWIEIQLDTSF